MNTDNMLLALGEIKGVLEAKTSTLRAFEAQVVFHMEATHYEIAIASNC